MNVDKRQPLYIWRQLFIPTELTCLIWYVSVPRVDSHLSDTVDASSI